MTRHGSPQMGAKLPSQRQLRAGELVRHALVEILQREELRDPALQGVDVTITEVRAAPDLKTARVFVAPLGAGDREAVAGGLNRCAGFLRGRLGKQIEMKFTPELRFVADDRFDQASRIDELLAQPSVKRDLDPGLADEVDD
ncbi:30S ribosome-binding factor RbfA [Hyphobacterium sp.]|uniref:30S ribosome-binding factor RbfA n=1 Tax=Hyphobacterium sp. TaxID=2004662 RepID=UPI003BA8AF89